MLCSVRRALLLGILAFVFICTGLPERLAHAQTGNWEYSEELGGWLDWDTGLVWGKQDGIAGWGDSNAYMSRLAASTGHPWRMPSVAESQVAFAHGIFGVPGIFYRAAGTWTSDAKNKGGARTAHYEFDFYTGTARLIGNNSLIDCIPVYRAFTP